MKSFSSRLTADRRLFAPGAAARPRDLATELRSAPRLEARPGPAAAPGASRRPFRKPGQALPPPPGLAGGLSASRARPCRRPWDRAGGHQCSKPGQAVAPGGIAALEASLRRVAGVSRL